jgi:8-oxo-dGTP diphosphatase
MNECFEVISRALIKKDDKILLCRSITRDYYFFPGGHVELGEISSDALVREMREERGSNIKNLKFIGLIENIYKEKENTKYEINIVFDAEEENHEIETITKEDHIEFEFMTIEEVKEADIRPVPLKEKIIEYIEKKEVFWKTIKED